MFSVSKAVVSSRCLASDGGDGNGSRRRNETMVGGLGGGGAALALGVCVRHIARVGNSVADFMKSWWFLLVA